MFNRIKNFFKKKEVVAAPIQNPSWEEERKYIPRTPPKSRSVEQKKEEYQRAYSGSLSTTNTVRSDDSILTNPLHPLNPISPISIYPTYDSTPVHTSCDNHRSHSDDYSSSSSSYSSCSDSSSSYDSGSSYSSDSSSSSSSSFD